MKHFTCSVLLAAAAAAVAASAPVAKRGDISSRAPIAEAFANSFPSAFHGKSEEDVEKFISKGAQVTADFAEDVLTWKRRAMEAAREADDAIAVWKRSLYISKKLSEDEAWVEMESERADVLAQRAAKLEREAEDAAETASQTPGITGEARNTALDRKREAEVALEESAEAYATLAYALQIRSSPQKADFFTTRDQTAAEMAMGQERRAKRELFFASKAARKREAVQAKFLKLRDEFCIRCDTLGK